MAIVALAIAVSGCATADLPVASIPSGPVPAMPSAVSSLAAPLADPMPASASAAVTPGGYVSFCLRFPDQCETTPNAPTSIALTPQAWATLAKVNSDVNAAIWPEDDSRHYGRVEYWTIPSDGYGDCEDYALTKRKNLAGLGLPLSALRIAVVVTPSEVRHAVLTVVTDKGDFVLDNLTNDILPWDQTGFTWIERQAPGNAMAWVSLRPADRMLASTGDSMITGGTH